MRRPTNSEFHAAVLEGQDLSVTPSRVSLVPGLGDTLCIPSLSGLQNEGAGFESGPHGTTSLSQITRLVLDSEAEMSDIAIIVIGLALGFGISIAVIWFGVIWFPL